MPESGDCNDNDPEVNPIKDEVCGDGKDNNCDGQIDENALPFYADQDGDGFGDTAQLSLLCERLMLYSTVGGDCDDTTGGTSPAAPDVCDDGLDNDCDGRVDESPSEWYRDLDRDGYGDAQVSQTSCLRPPGYVANRADCDDAQAMVRPDRWGDVCGDGVDDNCDGSDCFETRWVWAGDAYSVYLKDGAELAWTVELSTDASGDGSADLVVGAPHISAAGVQFTGQATVLLGPRPGSGSAEIRDLYIAGDYQDDHVGYDVSSGDSDGDGVAELLIAAPGDHAEAGGGLAGGPVEGFVYGFRRAQDLQYGFDAAAYAMSSTDQPSAFGHSVEGGGDVNGDGQDDVIVGDVITEQGAYRGGGAFVYFGPLSGARTQMQANATLLAATGYALMGQDVSIRGDVNGDGVADALVGASDEGSLTCMGGAAYLFYGPLAGVTSSRYADASFVTHHFSERLGYQVSNAGDFNGDGYNDVALAATEEVTFCKGQITDNQSRGRVYVFYGPVAGTYDVDSADLVFEGQTPGELMGIRMAAGADLNGDGCSDLVVGAPLREVNGVEEGAAYLFLTPCDGEAVVAQTPTLAFQVGVEHAWLGFGASAGGDVDGDGWPDLAIAATGENVPVGFDGGAYLFRGGPALFDLPFRVITE